MMMISIPFFIPSVLSSPKCLAARVWHFLSNSLLETLSVSLWTQWERGHIQLLFQQRKRRKVSQLKDATRKGDWNSLTGRKLSPLQMPSCLILTVVQLVNMCVIVFCSSVVPSSPFFLVVNTHPMPISQYRTSRKSQKFVTPHYWPVMHPATKTKTKTKIRIFF